MTRTPEAYFSILRWRKDPTRDEARNVAVILVNASENVGSLKATGLSHISPRLHEQGLLDDMLLSLEERIKREFSLDSLREMQASLRNSLYLTEPKATAVPDGNFDIVMRALYRAYVAPAGGGSRVLTKGKVLDGVVSTLRRHTNKVKRATYVNDYFFDVVINGGKKKQVLLEVLSFAPATKNWLPVEHDAGYFLRAIKELRGEGLAVIQPPGESSEKTAVESHARVSRWFEKEGVREVRPADLVDALELAPQLQLQVS